MEQLIICGVLGVFGLLFGSFAGATIWRLRAWQLKQDKKEGEKVDRDEYKRLNPLTKKSFWADRSRCLHCGHQLAWYDLLPIISWASTAGKCRYCHDRIGWFEPAIEIGMAIFFILSYLLWPENLALPLDLLHFGLWLIAGILLIILFVYDLRWFLLPNYIVFPLIGVAAVVAALQLIGATDIQAMLLDTALAVFLLSGLYLLLWVISKGQWIGFGDVKLGLALALLLADWQLAFIALFAANLIGCLVVIPGMVMGKINRKTRVPFGPLLIVGGVIAMLSGHYIIEWYFGLFI